MGRLWTDQDYGVTDALYEAEMLATRGGARSRRDLILRCALAIQREPGSVSMHLANLTAARRDLELTTLGDWPALDHYPAKLKQFLRRKHRRPAAMHP